jgi:hypothetical protein
MKGVITLKRNKPDTGFFLCFILRASTGKPRITPGFSSSGEYTRIAPCLPKYGRFDPRQMTVNGLSTAPVFATYFSPSCLKKGRRNANMRDIFSDGGLKNKGSIREPV